MKLERSVARLGNFESLEDGGYVEGTPVERISMVWNLTVASWAIATKGKIHAESRLQRDVATLRKT
jgi:hypothetical protein